MMPIGSEQRFNWINGFMCASLNSVLAYSGISSSQFANLNFNRTLCKYVEKLSARSAGFCAWPAGQNIQENDIGYLFHLEMELWGNDYQNYLEFFEQNNVPMTFPESFRFVNAFFLLERWFDHFLATSNIGRRKRREYIFGSNGVLTQNYANCLDILGPPFFLRTRYRNVFPIISNPNNWSFYQNENIPDSLRRFYNSCTQRSHFYGIIQAAFLETRKKLPRHLYSSTKERRKNSRVLAATFYDVFWVYSESFRYRDLHLPDEVYRKPFFWNRTIRWLPSILITGILFILAKTPSTKNKLHSIWRSSLTKSTQLESIFSQSRGGIFDV